MNELNRRRFIKNSLAGAGAIVASPAFAGETKTSGQATDRVTLGKTGITASRLAMGSGMHGSRQESDHTRLGQKKFTELFRHGYDNGLNFFDMADLYGSHTFMKNALEGIPREKYTLLSKLWYRPHGEWIQPSGGAKAELDRFRKELGTDMIDIVLMHCVNKPSWPDDLKQIRDDLSELKEKGVVRAIGASFHNLESLKVAAEHPWTDVILARINNQGTAMDGPPEEVAKTLMTARKNGKAILGMKIFGEGKLNQPEQKDASLKYVLGNNLVDAMTIGMLKTEEVDDSIMRIGKAMKS